MTREREKINIPLVVYYRRKIKPQVVIDVMHKFNIIPPPHVVKLPKNVFCEDSDEENGSLNGPLVARKHDERCERVAGDKRENMNTVEKNMNTMEKNMKLECEGEKDNNINDKVVIDGNESIKVEGDNTTVVNDRNETRIKVEDMKSTHDKNTGEISEPCSVEVGVKKNKACNYDIKPLLEIKMGCGSVNSVSGEDKNGIYENLNHQWEVKPVANKDACVRRVPQSVAEDVDRVLRLHPEGVALEKFCSTLLHNCGKKLVPSHYGFTDVVELLKALPDCVRMRCIGADQQQVMLFPQSGEMNEK